MPFIAKDKVNIGTTLYVRIIIIHVMPFIIIRALLKKKHQTGFI